MSGPDLVKFDVTGVQRLRSAVLAASFDLAADHVRLRPLLIDAGARLGIDQAVHLDRLRRVRARLDEMATDLTVRLKRVMATLADVHAIEDLSVRIAGWDDHGSDPHLAQLVRHRNDLVRAFIGGSDSAALAVTRLVDTGVPLLDAVDAVVENERERRIEALMEADGIDRSTAVSRVARFDEEMRTLVDSGMDPTDAVAAVSISDTLELDLDLAVARARSHQIDVIEALGHMALAANLGLTLDEALTIESLRAHFASFDNAIGGRHDGRVSREDVEFVMANPARFAPVQVAAAAAILDSPELFARLDTAASNDDVLSGDRFGALSGGDGVVSMDDLQAFVVKTQLSHVLGEYSEQIDVAADPGGEVDRFVSRADLESFLADTPDLPTEVRAATAMMLDAGMFDRTWLEDHRDELALGAAVVAGITAGVVITMSAGTATPLVVVGAGAVAGSTAGAGTTLAINAADEDADVFDDVAGNAVRGGLLGATAANLPLGFVAVGSAVTLPSRMAAAASVVSDSASITWAGGADILLPESIEDEVHSTADFVSSVTGPAGDFRR